MLFRSRDFLQTLVTLDLVENVAPVQLALRLLIPQGSRMLELPEVRLLATRFDPTALTWRWTHPDAEVERLSHTVFKAVSEERPRAEAFALVWDLVCEREMPVLVSRATIPYLTEPWYC